MKKISAIIGVCLMGLGLSTAAFCADATLNLDVNSAYVSRGYTYSDGMVLQPSLDVAKGGFDVNIWGNMNMTNYHNSLDTNEFSEVDLYVGYTRVFDKLAVTGGIYQYIYPPMDSAKTLGLTPNGANTEELYLNGALDLGSGLALGLSVYYDVDTYKDWCYSNLNLGYTYSVNKKLAIIPSIAAGYISKPESDGKSGFKDYRATLKATYALTDTIGLGANINYTDAIDSDVLNSHNDNNFGSPGHDVHTYGGVTVNCKF